MSIHLLWRTHQSIEFKRLFFILVPLGYGGPCPPIGRHRYFFKLYALDTVLPDLKEPTKLQLEAAMKGHILEETVLVGTYHKVKNKS